MVDVPDVGGNVVVGGVYERLVQIHQQHQLPTLDQSKKHILLSLSVPHCFLLEKGRRTLKTTDTEEDSVRIRILLF